MSIPLGTSPSPLWTPIWTRFYIYFFCLKDKVGCRIVQIVYCIRGGARSARYLKLYIFLISGCESVPHHRSTCLFEVRAIYTYISFLYWGVKVQSIAAPLTHLRRCVKCALSKTIIFFLYWDAIVRCNTLPLVNSRRCAKCALSKII